MSTDDPTADDMRETIEIHDLLLTMDDAYNEVQRNGISPGFWGLDPAGQPSTAFEYGYSYAFYHVKEQIIMQSDKYTCECEYVSPELQQTDEWQCGRCETVVATDDAIPPNTEI